MQLCCSTNAAVKVVSFTLILLGIMTIVSAVMSGGGWMSISCILMIITGLCGLFAVYKPVSGSVSYSRRLLRSLARVYDIFGKR